MHSGHRQRMRDRIAKNGLDSLTDHELLEYLLFYIQPRVNTNEPAHRLIDTYGSFSAVLDTDEKSLSEIEGIGPKSAQFLSLLPEIARRYLNDKYTPKTVFDSTFALRTYIQQMYLGIKDEAAAIVLLDGQYALISSKIVARGNVREIYIDQRDILLEVMQKRAPYVVLSHNHPSNSCKPSVEDIVMTNRFATALNVVGSTLIEHLIIYPNGTYYSFARDQRL